MRTPAREKINRALAARGTGLDDLAQAVGLKPSSLTNILNGSARSRISQRAITNFCRIKIWPGIDVTERVVSLPVGTIIALPNDAAVKEFVHDAGTNYAFSANATRLEFATELRIPLTAKKIPSPSARNHPQPLERE